MSTTTTKEIEFLKKHLIQEKSYVVTETNYEYNDSTYDLNGETPINIFVDLEKAKQFILEKTHERIKGENIYGYGFYDLDDVFKNGKDKEDLEKLGIKTDDYDIDIPATFTLKQTKELLDILDLKFFEVHEVDVVL